MKEAGSSIQERERVTRKKEIKRWNCSTFQSLDEEEDIFCRVLNGIRTCHVPLWNLNPEIIIFED